LDGLRVTIARAATRSAADQADKDETRKLVSAIIYPSAAGPATKVLLDAVRTGYLDVPSKEAGTPASLAWVAEK
jgi:predicted RNase H-like nuclease